MGGMTRRQALWYAVGPVCVVVSGVLAVVVVLALCLIGLAWFVSLFQVVWPDDAVPGSADFWRQVFWLGNGLIALALCLYLWARYLDARRGLVKGE